MAKKTKLIIHNQDDDVFGLNQTSVQKANILKRELPHLINDVTMLVKRPFRFIWDESVGTASTDCLAEIRVAPRPFLNGEKEVGYGTVYHETGHICYSPYGVPLLTQANEEGGEVLQSIMNIILDRKDDFLTARNAPGFADILRKRLLVIRTIGRRERYKDLLKGKTLRQQSCILRNFKPTDSFEDFFLAAKCGKSPRTKSGAKAMKYVKASVIISASPEKLLWIGKKVRKILVSDIKKDETKIKEKSDTSQTASSENENQTDSNSKSNKIKKIESDFVKLWYESERAINGGKKLDQETKNNIEGILKQYLGALRSSGLKSILKKITSMGIVYPGPISVGIEKPMPVVNVKYDSKHTNSYRALLEQVQELVSPMVKILRNINTPSEFELYGQEEGELDLTEVSRIASGLSGFYMETVVERDIDAEIHLAIDASGSMADYKIGIAKKIAVVFSEAIQVLEPHCYGNIWSFNSHTICDYGKPSQNSGFVEVSGGYGNSDTHMLAVVGKKLIASKKRRKILFVLCDDGPDDMELVKKLSMQLTARGVIVVHMLVGVHGTPDIYPIELLYTNMEECLEEFGTLLQTIISHIK